MSAEIKLIVGGKEVSPENFGNAMKAQVYKHVRDSIAEKLRTIRCPEHGGAPQVTAEGSSLDNLTWKVSGCCEKLRDEALKVLR
jgi:hypothetical protein